MLRRRRLGSRIRAGAALLSAITLSACVGFSDDGGMSIVASVAGSQLEKDVLAIRTPEDAAQARARVELLLSRALTADSAVQIALLNNRGLQAAYNALGSAEATMVKAILPPNPSFSISRIAGPLKLELEAIIAADILALATLPARTEIAADRFHQAQLRAAEETLRLAARARRDYYRAVAARELVDFLAKANSTAEAAAQLARALGETGAMNKLDQAREQVFYADLTAQLAKARQRAIAEREQLIRSLGLWGDDLDFKLPAALPAPPSRPQNMPMVEQEAVARRPDLFVAGIELDALAKSYGLVGATRFVNVFQLSGIYKDTRETVTSVSSDGTIDTENVRFRVAGPGATIEIPIFDLGEARTREAEQNYMQAFNRLAAKAVDIRSEARLAYRAYRSTWDIANHYQREILPLRKIIVDESLLRYNAMLIDVFPLLAEVRQRILARIASIEAKRDFWLASTDLRAAVIGGAEARVEETSGSRTEAIGQ
ncbi:TolC family protein [Methylosinus sp. Sm6]|uniref:TolC family protein n=1 Tax=Methylosinus sp. Sm6 TaxID=2866948 RepID=UPI001C9A2228|nr:TolC family protein [Methylosinus sp. Sm6]